MKNAKPMLNYNLNIEKREIQKKLFPLVTKQRVVTLAGPNLVSYMKLYPKTVREVQIWENKPDVMVFQLEQLSRLKRADGRVFDYHYGDIIQAPVNDKSFYDLDFCCNIANAEGHLERFRKCQYAVTICIRPSTLEKTIERFLLAIREKKRIDMPHRQFNLLKTNKSQYLYTTYKDSVAMTTIFKLD